MGNKKLLSHTPTPWKVEEGINNDQFISNDEDVICSLHGLSDYETRQQNAEFIVRACNNFQKILDALEQVQIIVDSEGGMDRLGIAIAKVIEEAKK